MGKRNPLIRSYPKKVAKPQPQKSAGILDDFAVRKNVATKEGTIEKVPVNNSDIANKKYVDDGDAALLAAIYWKRTGTVLAPITAGDDITTTGTGTFGDLIVLDYNSATTRGIHWFPTDASNNYVEIGGAIRVGLNSGTVIKAIDGTNDILQLTAAGNQAIYMNYGRGTGGVNIYDGGVSNKISIAHGYINATGYGSLKLQSNGAVPIRMFDACEAGETQEVKIYGQSATSGSRKSLQIGVEIDADDTASFDGVSNYYFDGKVCIGTASPATSAALEIDSTTGALLVPRMTTTQRDNLTAIDGMIVYDTNLNAFHFYEDGAWIVK